MAFIYQSSHFVFPELAERSSWAENGEEKCLFATDANKNQKNSEEKNLLFVGILKVIEEKRAGSGSVI